MNQKLTVIACMSILMVLGTVTFTYADEIVQEAPLFVAGFPEPDPFKVVGHCTLIRTEDGIAFSIESSTVMPIDTMGHAVTVWCAIFNFPEECIEPGGPLGNLCGGQEQRNEELRNIVQADLLRVDGDIVDDIIVDEISDHDTLEDGTFVRLSGFLPVGDSTESLRPEQFGLINPLTAEIHFIVRSHGKMVPGRILEQIHTLEGGCKKCQDIQAAVFEAPE